MPEHDRGTRQVENCTFLGDTGPTFGGQQDFHIDNNYFNEYFYANIAAPLWASFDDNFIRKSTGDETVTGGDVTNSYFFNAAGASDGFFLVSNYASETVSGNVFQYDGSDTDTVYAVGLSEGSFNPRVITVTDNVMTLNAAGDASGPILVAATNTSSDYPIVANVTHNTVPIGSYGGILISGAGTGERPGSLGEVQDNLFWTTGSAQYSAITNRFATPVTDVVNSNDITNNAYSSLAAVPAGTWNDAADGTVYSTPMSGTTAPGGNDINLGTISDAQTQGPMFVDPTRNLESWDASLGGPGISSPHGSRSSRSDQRLPRATRPMTPATRRPLWSRGSARGSLRPIQP